MNKTALVFSMLLILSGCSTVQEASSFIPSFWDDNQSAAIIDVRQSVEELNCKEAHARQADKIYKQIVWFELYSESKGARQQDVLELISPLKTTTKEFLNRSTQNQGSIFYCEGKKSILKIQAEKAAEAVMRRF